MRFPPADLQAALAHQLLSLETAREASRDVRLPTDRCLVLIETSCDPETVQHTARLRNGDAAPALESAQVVGFLANMTANRINSQFDLTAPGYAVGAEGPGSDVLGLAMRAIRAGEADAAVVGAVDVSCPAIGEAPSDAAVTLVLKRLDLARRDGERVMAILDPGSAKGSLVSVAAEVIARFHGARLEPHGAAKPRLGATLSSSVDEAGHLDGPADSGGWLAHPPPRWHVYSGPDRGGVLAALEDQRESREE